MEWRPGLWSSDSVITEMSVRRTERRRKPEGGEEEEEGGRAREPERGNRQERERGGRGQHFHAHIPSLAQHLLFGFFHSTALECLLLHTQHEHSALCVNLLLYLMSI